MNRRRVVILGASGNALDILDIIDALGAPWEAAGVLDDRRDKGSKFADLPIVGSLAQAAALADVVFINGIASERTHRRKLGIIAGTGLDAARFITLIHPLAAVSRRAAIGNGSCIGPGCAVSGQVEIGAHSWLGSHAVIGHECVLGAGVTVAPSATLAGGVTLGAQAYVGTGAMLRPGITVGEGALIGMGAVVLRDVPAGMVVVGNPARPLVRSTAQCGATDQMRHGRVGTAASALSQGKNRRLFPWCLRLPSSSPARPDSSATMSRAGCCRKGTRSSAWTTSTPTTIAEAIDRLVQWFQAYHRRDTSTGGPFHQPGALGKQAHSTSPRWSGLPSSPTWMGPGSCSARPASNFSRPHAGIVECQEVPRSRGRAPAPGSVHQRKRESHADQTARHHPVRLPRLR